MRMITRHFQIRTCTLEIDGKLPRPCLYFDLHATLDVKHSLAWNSEVIAPLIELDPRVAPWIAEGALMRLNAGARCFRRYRAQLRVGVATSDAVTVDR